MILGAGIGQLPAIKKAVELGLYVITVDYLPNNIGHKFAHQSVNCSTVDKDGVLKAAQEIEIDGIITFASDVATATVGYVAEKLNLPGYRYSTAGTMSNKAQFRAFQQQHGLNYPSFVTGQNWEEVRECVADLSTPVMFKPVDTSGSRGITKLDSFDEIWCRQAFEYAQKHSRSRTVCIEKFVRGVDVSGDGYFVNGQLVSSVITCKYSSNFVVTGHSLPTNISVEAQKAVFAEVLATCHALEYTDGPLDFDARVSSTNVTILEMSPRLGGNGIPMLIEHGTGIDLTTATLSFCIGEKINIPFDEAVVKRNCGSWIFGSNQRGRLDEIASDAEIHSAIPEIFEYHTDFYCGDDVPQFNHNGNSLGYALFNCPSEMHYSEIVDRLRLALRLKVTTTES